MRQYQTQKCQYIFKQKPSSYPILLGRVWLWFTLKMKKKLYLLRNMAFTWNVSLFFYPFKMWQCTTVKYQTSTEPLISCFFWQPTEYVTRKIRFSSWLWFIILFSTTKKKEEKKLTGIESLSYKLPNQLGAHQHTKFIKIEKLLGNWIANRINHNSIQTK